MEVQLYSFVTSAVVGGKCSAVFLLHRYPLCKGLGGAQSQCGHAAENVMPLPAIGPRFIRRPAPPPPHTELAYGTRYRGPRSIVI